MFKGYNLSLGGNIYVCFLVVSIEGGKQVPQKSLSNSNLKKKRKTFSVERRSSYQDLNQF